MVFSSIVFLAYFLLFFFLLYFVLPNRFKNLFIVLASILFYSWGAPKFIFVILGTTLLDFFLVRLMHSRKKLSSRKWLLTLSVITNVSLLFYFKYCNFFIENINQVLESYGLQKWEALNVVLPIGISFYTFETLTYVIDVYRKEHPPQSNFLNYLLYIIFFPKLIAGPIIKYSEIAQQIQGRFNTFSYDFAMKGFHRFCIGLAKKVLIANTLGAYASLVFDENLLTLSANIAWLGALSYTFQIYFDFSGYSDMALGLAQMMGFKFPENFNHPYTAVSVTEFWRKWHISLGTWMKNYLYIPLGGNKSKSKLRLYFNLWLVFLLSGLWHGAQWTFIVWGLYHGAFLVAERSLYGKYLNKIKWISIPITFMIVLVGWVIFKSETIDKALHFLKAMLHFNYKTTFIEFNTTELYSTLLIALLFSFFVLIKPFQKMHQTFYFSVLSNTQNIVITVMCFVLLLLSMAYITASDFNPFIYFRF